MPHGLRWVARIRRFAVVALLLASGSVALASAPRPDGERDLAGLRSEALIAGWVMVFLAVTALYSIERRQRARLGPSSARIAPERRPIERLLKKKTARSTQPAPPLEAPGLAPERSPSLEPPNRRGVRESGEESFRIVDAEEPPSAPALMSTPVAQPAPAPLPAAPERDAGEEPPQLTVSEPPAPASPLERCATLRAANRFDEAAHAARGGLARADGDAGSLLIELSLAELGLGRVNAATDTARDAHFAARSRESVRHLIWILIETRRFVKEDGDTLRRAALRHPGQALLRHAVGVYEALHGEPHVAVRELRAALRLEKDPGRRRAIGRDLAGVRKRLARKRGPETG